MSNTGRKRERCGLESRGQERQGREVCVVYR